MAKKVIKVSPQNGLNIPHCGHLKHGAHVVDLTATQLKELKQAQGITISDPVSEKETK